MDVSITTTAAVMLVASKRSKRIAGRGTSMTNTMATPSTGTTQSLLVFVFGVIGCVAAMLSLRILVKPLTKRVTARYALES
jgi:hypothetical protein